MDRNRDSESPTHRRPPYADPLADGLDPTAPGAPHEPGGVDYHQSDEGSAPKQDAEEKERKADVPPIPHSRR